MSSVTAPSAQPATERATFAPARWLRWIGALTFIGAGASFLVEGWSDPSVIKRQALWAAGTLILTLLGIVVVRRFRDAVGGRVFLGLAAATIPAHFAQLGSALYDLRKDSGELGSVAVAGLITAALLPPLALGMSALIRRRARTLTLLMFVFSAPLVIPSRDPNVIALLASALVAFWLVLEGTLFRSDELFESREGVAARLMLVAPALIMIARNSLHAVDEVWIAMTFGVPSAILLVWPRLRGTSSAAAVVAQLVGVAGLLVAIAFIDAPVLPLTLAFSVALLLGAELVYARPPLLAWAAVTLLVASAVVAYAERGWLPSLAIVPLGTLHALAAFRRRNAWLFATTILATCAGALAHLVQLVVFPKHDVWLAAAALGVTLLALASLLESRKAQIQRMTSRLHHHFRAAE